ncbi:MAG: hypothetical protein ACKO9Q_08395 [Pirellula sp.]
MQTLRERYATLGEIAVEFFEGLLAKTRYSKHHPQKVLTLTVGFHRNWFLGHWNPAVLGSRSNHG